MDGSHNIHYYLLLILVISFKTEIHATNNEVESPNEQLCMDYQCGYPNDLPVHRGKLANGTEYEMYHFNRTAELLESEGYTVKVEAMFGDAIRILNYTNGTFAEQIGFESTFGFAPVGGKPALRHRRFYMALLGQREKGKTVWLCDGILINAQWVLSAAHCFFSGTNSINVIRLGEYDLNKLPVKLHDDHVVDYTIEKIIVHPLYESGKGYHDLVLLKLPNKVGTMHVNISPICLPWGNETNRKHIGDTLTLSGWGTTSYHAAGKTTILTEVELKVYNSSKCNDSYSNLWQYQYKWSHGMTESEILCAGSDEGGKDACKGDSGAPLVYLRDDGSIVLAAVVSAGFGCGLKDYPGLYIPINNPSYLKWIKDVAFKDCSKMSTG